MSYLIDYQVNSETAPGAKNKGSVYIRGIRNEKGWDSFKFVLEKNVDFNQVDVDIVVNAIEESVKQNPPKKEKQKKYESRGTSSNGSKKEMSSGAETSEEENKDPVSALEQHNCTVFMPD